MADEKEITGPRSSGGAERSAGFPERLPNITLSDVDRRRTQLWSVSLFVVGMLMAVIAILLLGEEWLPEDIRLENLSSWVFGVLIGGLLLAFLIYVVEKERSLRRLTKLLVEERVRSTTLSTWVSELSALSEVGKALNATLRVEEVFRLILGSSLDLLGANEGAIMLMNDSKKELEIASYKGPREEEMKERTVLLDETIMGEVAEKQQPLLLHADEIRQRDGDFLDGVQSAMCVPLVRRDELLGVLSVHETEGKKVFTELDLNALEFFAEHAAIAIGNARLFQSERETIARLEELDRLKSDFVATVSHELKTPLTAIIGGAKTVGSRGSRMSPEQHSSFMRMIERQGTRLLRLVEDVLTASRIESGLPRLTRQLVDLKKLIDSVVEDLVHSMQERRQDIIVYMDRESPQAWGDPTALHQIINNLVENALKYSDVGSKVTVSAGESAHEAVVEVSDEGQGISPDQLSSIFDRFRQADSLAASNVTGFGLGLYIVKNLVEAHWGEVEVESEIGQGSTFRVRFPKRAANR
jgi:two-component system, OmpR family, sensor histidine kinase KdpD